MPPPSDTAPPPTPYIGQLTALRGLACLFVLIGHVIQVFNYRPAPGAASTPWAGMVIRGLFNAQGAVLMFFVLSGCVLALSLKGTAQLGRGVVAGFYIKRVFRLYPLLWLSTFIAISSVLSARHVADQGVFAAWLQANLQAPITALHTLLSMAGLWTKYDGPMWSLRVELIYSALFPVVYLLIHNPRSRLWCIAALLGVALLPVADPQYGTAFGISFGLGALIPFLPRANSKPHFVMMLVAFIALCYDRALLGAAHPPEIVFDLIETIAAFVIVRDVYAGRRRYALLGYRPLIRIGEISYSIYLLHLPILLMIFVLLSHFTGVTMLLDHPSLTQIGLAGLTLAATLSLSYLTFTYVESPLHNFGRQLAGRIAKGRPADETIGGGVAAGLTPSA